MRLSLPKLSRLTAAGALEGQADRDASTQKKRKIVEKIIKYIYQDGSASCYGAQLCSTLEPDHDKSTSPTPHPPRSKNMDIILLTH